MGPAGVRARIVRPRQIGARNHPYAGVAPQPARRVLAVADLDTTAAALERLARTL